MRTLIVGVVCLFSFVTWADKSGNGRNAVADNADRQPVYTLDANGKQVLTFSDSANPLGSILIYSDTTLKKKLKP